MELLEVTKTKYVYRYLLYLGSILCASLTTYLSDFRGFFLFLSIPFFTLSIIYIFRDMIFAVRGYKLVGIESRSKNILWIVFSSMFMIILIQVSATDVACWTLLMVLIMLNGLIREYRQKTLLVNKKSIGEIGFAYQTRIYWKDIDKVSKDEDSLSIQAKNKEYIHIDLTKSTQNEIANIISILNNIEQYKVYKL